jgi:RNA polymerase sigma factor (sigma-70 family)
LSQSLVWPTLYLGKPFPTQGLSRKKKMKNRHTRPQLLSAPLPLADFTERFPLVPNRAATAARLLLGNAREHLVEEVVNEVLLLLWRRQRDGKLPHNPEGWAYRVAWNRAARLARVEGRYAGGLIEQAEDAEEAHTGYFPMPPDEVTPLDGAELAERLAALNKLFQAFESAAGSQLNEQESLLFKLVYTQKLRGQEVARQLGVTPEVVRQQWSRMLTKLLGTVRKQLQQDPLCNVLLGAVLSNEKTFRRKLVAFLRVVLKDGVEELEKLVKSAFKT